MPRGEYSSLVITNNIDDTRRHFNAMVELQNLRYSSLLELKSHLEIFFHDCMALKVHTEIGQNF